MNCCRLSPYCIYSFKLNPTCVFGAVTQHFSIICAKFFNSKKKELILYYTNFEEARVSCVYYFSLLVYSGLQKIEKRRERKERRISWFHEKKFILTYLKIILILLQPPFFGDDETDVLDFHTHRNLTPVALRRRMQRSPGHFQSYNGSFFCH